MASSASIMEQRLLTNYVMSSTFRAGHFQLVGKARIVGRNLVHLSATPSTQNVARMLAEMGAQTGSVVVADVQTKGLGRGANRQWSSPIGNLYATFILRPRSLIEALKINLGASVAVARAARALGANAGVKWPNDIWINDKKLSGILTDSSGSTSAANEGFLLLGVGVNLNERMCANADPVIAQHAISLVDHLGIDVEREAFLAKLCEELEVIMTSTQEEVVNGFKQLCILTGKEIVVMPRKREMAHVDSYTATCLGIDATGQLRIRVGADERLLCSEEVSVRSHINARNGSD